MVSAILDKPGAQASNRDHTMKRRAFLRHAGWGVASAWMGMPVLAQKAFTTMPAAKARATGSVTIRDYLSVEAQMITRNALGAPADARRWRRTESGRRAQFLEMMGVGELAACSPRPPLQPVITGVVERPRYRIEKLYFESLPRLYVTANLYVPRELTGPVPGVLYVCGHAANQKVHYQAHPRRFAELGFVCLIVETIQLGEVQGFHHGCYREGWFHWYSRGYTPAGIEMWNGMRALDLLCARPEVDPQRLGVTGISGGGAVSWWIAAGDARVGVAAPVCGTATLGSHVTDRTVDGHCDCMWWINSRRWDLADVGGLIAPRPLLIASADRDGIFTIASIREVHTQLARLYRRLGAADRLRLVETPGGHSYHERSRTAIFSWFLRHLQRRKVAAAVVGDIDTEPGHQETVETLRVYTQESPPGNRTATIQDELCVREPFPPITTIADLNVRRAQVVAALRERTFGAFPVRPPDLSVRMEYEEDESGYLGGRFAITTESGWRLRGRKWRPKSVVTPAPAVIALRMPGEGRWDTRSFVLGIAAPWVKVEFEPRGTGETAWGEDLNWHIRRAAAWTGRTVASMRVWDVLRALEAVRRMPEVAGQPVALAARGEMAAVALYAALLDGGIRTLFLESPPGTQDQASQKDGRGPATEMLNCLRVTDLPEIAGLLWPAELVVTGEWPAKFGEAEQLYQRLGPPGRLRRLASVVDWRPA